jgi:hypothetical protein
VQRFAGSGKNPAGSGYRVMTPANYHPSKFDVLKTVFDVWAEDYVGVDFPR